MDQLTHFSHNHGLSFHQVTQGSQIQCSGCKSPPGPGNFWVCWPCNYFLHEQCFHATRFLKHPSHPLHSLTLVPFPTYPSGSFLCNSCSLSGDGFSYTCSQCEFDIHVHCALTPNANPHVSPSPNPNFSAQNHNPIYPPQTCTIPNDAQISTEIIIIHFSHPHVLKPMEIEQDDAKLCSACEQELSGSAYCCAEPNCSFNLHKVCFDSPREMQHDSHLHQLTLLLASEGFTCNACVQQGKGFVYTCVACSYNLHIDCIRWAETVTRPIHEHPLKLYHSVAEASRDVSLICNVCEQGVHPNAWRYCCGDQCGFRVHTMCAYKEQSKKSELSPLEQLKILQDLDLQMQMVRFHSQMLGNIGSSWL